MMTPNKSLQRTFDPPPIFAIAKTAVASNAAELKCWADQGLDIVVPPIDAGPVAFTHPHDACPT